MLEYDILFQPLTVRSLNLKNRVAMAPMGRSSAPAGVPVEAAAAYYARRAKGGAGLIISEATAIDRPGSRNDPNAPNFFGSALPRWRDVLDAVHQEGAAMARQLTHVGALPDPTNPAFKSNFESPSGFAGDNIPNGRMMSDSDIADTVAAFASAAASAKSMGHDMVEIHGGHGYLIDQFFWSVTNRRDDRFNGDLKTRATFAAEIISAVRKAVGPEFPLSIRISQWKLTDFAARNAQTPDELEQWVGALSDAGIDIFHCSQRRIWEAEFAGSDLNLAGWVKQLTGKPTISVGSITLGNDLLESVFQGEAAQPTGLSDVIRRMERGEFDIIAVGRAMIANPDWADIVKQGDIGMLRGFDRGMLATLE